MAFNNCIEIILKHEGGYVNNPKDSGGETKYGIIKRYFPDLDIKNLTIEDAKSIYYEKYWQPMLLDQINDENIQLEIFDYGINAGIRRAIRTAQQICKIMVDGLMGIQTIQAINTFKADFVYLYKHARRVHYEFLANKYPKNEKFLKGWLNRIENNHF